MVYATNNDNIVAALIKTNKQGKDIYIITDRLQLKSKYSKVGNLIESKIKLNTNRKHKIEQNKFAIFDDDEVVSDSFNWTNSVSSKNSENCIFFSDQNQKLSKHFNYLWLLFLYSCKT